MADDGLIPCLGAASIVKKHDLRRLTGKEMSLKDDWRRAAVHVTCRCWRKTVVHRQLISSRGGSDIKR